MQGYVFASLNRRGKDSKRDPRLRDGRRHEGRAHEEGLCEIHCGGFYEAFSLKRAWVSLDIDSWIELNGRSLIIKKLYGLNEWQTNTTSKDAAVREVKVIVKNREKRRKTLGES